MSKNVVITHYQNKTCSFLINYNRLIQMQVLNDCNKIGSIYIGKIKNVLKNIQAYFVEIADKEICFLPFSETENVFCLNRNVTGPLVQGDEILVQISKEAQKTKQASVTCNISKTGKHFVFTVGNNKLGISNKLSKPVKNAIQEVLIKNELMDETGKLQYQDHSVFPQFGAVIRTEAGMLYNESSETFISQFKEELQAFLTLLDASQYKSCFQCVYKPQLSYLELLSPYGINEYDEIVTDLNEAYTALQAHSKPIRLYEDSNYTLSKLYSLETKVNEALKKQIWLKSGANIIIESTECLTTIDVNSAKKTKKSLTEDDILAINTEAALEAALQIRLRNLSGIIIVDFINMQEPKAEEQLLEHMKALVSKDTVPTNVIDITPLGLMEITRKKINKPLSEQLRG